MFGKHIDNAVPKGAAGKHINATLPKGVAGKHIAKTGPYAHSATPSILTSVPLNGPDTEPDADDMGGGQ